MILQDTVQNQSAEIATPSRVPSPGLSRKSLRVAGSDGVAVLCRHRSSKVCDDFNFVVESG